MSFRFVSIFAIAAFSSLLMHGVGNAASCIGPDTLPADQLNSFKGAPAAYFAGKSGDALIDSVAALAASDSTLVSIIMSTFNASSDEDKASIAKGLGKAAKKCSSFPDEGNRILESMIGQPQTIKAAFNDGAGQALAGAVGGGAGGGSSGGASGGQTSTVFAQNSNTGDGSVFNDPTPNGGLNALFGGAGGGGQLDPTSISISP